MFLRRLHSRTASCGFWGRSYTYLPLFAFVAIAVPLSLSIQGTELVALFKHSEAPSTAVALLKQYPPVTADVARDVVDPDTKTIYKLRLRFESRVEFVEEARTFRYSYSFSNSKESNVPVRIEWTSLETWRPFLWDATRQRGFLQPGQPHSPIVRESTAAPRVFSGAVVLYVAMSTKFDSQVATGWAPAYVPETTK